VTSNEEAQALETNDAPMRRLILISGGSFAVLAIAMTVTGLLLGPSGPTLLDDLVQIAQEPTTRVSFMIASLLPLFVAPFMVALAIWAPPSIPPTTSDLRRGKRGWRDPVRVSAAVLALLYAPLSLFAYASQYLLVPKLAEIDPDQAAVWFLINEDSFALGLDLFAYFIWGLAAVLIAWRLRNGPSLLRATAAILALSGVTSIIAYPLHAGGSDIGGVLSAFSGGLSVVAAVTVGMHVLRAGPGTRS